MATKQVTRYDPLFNPKPRSEVAAVEGTHSETASANIDSIGHCPVEGCGAVMQVLSVGTAADGGDISAYVCMEHRIVLPLQD